MKELSQTLYCYFQPPRTIARIRLSAGVDSADVYFILPVTPLWEEDWSQRLSAGVDSADVYFILPVTPLWEEDWSQRRPADVVSQTFISSCVLPSL